MSVLRQGLLEGRAIVTAPAGGGALDGVLTGLGARVEALEPEPGFGEWARARAPLHALVYDARGVTSTDEVWVVIREVAVGALIPSEAPGKVVLIGPVPGRDGAAAMRDALENLARTLSVEWARFGVTTTMVAPEGTARDDDLAEIVAFLCSPAGEYFSGCRLELR
jgi:NAD(P)-dependent dehydrogenase (short-subunit alcohol dehydrogenase family)